MSHDRMHQTIQLPDGRRLGYAESGDLQGKPVFFFGGSNSTRLIQPADMSTLTKLGVHLYTFDRPGMGLSDFQPQRTLLAWADDIHYFADHQQIDRFWLVAVSQGGPYGAVCAYRLADRLYHVALVSAVSPLHDPAVFAAQNPMIKNMIRLVRVAPWAYHLILFLSRPMVLYGNPDRLVRSMLSNLPPSDQALLNTPGVVDGLIADVRESVRQGTRGAVVDFQVCIGDWGFQLQDIRAKVTIWQGEEDRNVPPVMARYLATHIPNSDTKFVAGIGHFLMFSHFDEIMSYTIAGANSANLHQ